MLRLVEFFELYRGARYADALRALEQLQVPKLLFDHLLLLKKYICKHSTIIIIIIFRCAIVAMQLIPLALTQVDDAAERLAQCGVAVRSCLGALVRARVVGVVVGVHFC